MVATAVATPVAAEARVLASMDVVAAMVDEMAAAWEVEGMATRVTEVVVAVAGPTVVS